MSLLPLGILGQVSAATSAGAFELITTITPTASSFSFTSIPATYTHLQIRATVRSNYSSTNMGFTVTFNGDTAANYSYHNLRGANSAISSGATASASNYSGLSNPAGMAAANYFSGFVWDILDYANTNKYKTSRILNGFVTASNSNQITLDSSSWRSTAAINQITFNVVVGSVVTGTRFSLYGIKGA
jgi:hypothetical protein